MQDDAGIVQRLVATWRERRVPLNSGASQAELADLSRMLGMELPKDIREFYSLANGMPDMSYDDHEVSFWSISKIREEHGKWNDSELGFADFLIHSWRFVFRVDDRGVFVLSENVALGQSKDDLGRVSDVFEIYLENPSRLGVL